MSETSYPEQPEHERDPLTEKVLAYNATHNEALFADIWEKVQPRVKNLAMKMLNNNDADADEVVQEVGVVLTRNLATFQGDSQFATWLHRVTVNAALVVRKKNSTRRTRIGETLPDERQLEWPEHDEHAGEFAGLDLGQSRQILFDAIEQIGINYRMVVVLSDLEELPARDIAETLGLSVSAVKSRLHRGREELKEKVWEMFAVEMGEPMDMAAVGARRQHRNAQDVRHVPGPAA